jgi:hypothetical protein
VADFRKVLPLLKQKQRLQLINLMQVISNLKAEHIRVKSDIVRQLDHYKNQLGQLLQTISYKFP